MDYSISSLHKPVLLEEVLSFVEENVKGSFTFVDMTLGRGGHSSQIIKKLNCSNLNYYGFDRDKEAIEFVKDKFKDLEGNINIVQEKFSNAIDYLESVGADKADLILFDIGVSSPQFDDPNRGFTYRETAPLDMRMDQSQSLDAKKVINTYSEKELADIIYNYGDEIYSRSIAKNIVKRRAEKEIETTTELADIIKEALPKKELHKDHHPAKKTFMAIRYEVNKEWDELTIGLEKAIHYLKPQGKLLIITFNSKEDKLVKDVFNKYTKEQFVSKYLPPDTTKIDYTLLTKKPISPSEAEVEENLRSKPAKLRVIQKKGV